LMLLAFDYHVNQAGEELPALSAFHTSNERVLSLAKLHSGVVACASVHPYRKDALERLEQVAAGGALAIKWLPNAMGIDPADARCDAFYKRMAELNLVLQSHTGIEKAVHAEAHQKFGNPLRLRRALDAGVRVVAAHSASKGKNEDLDGRRIRPARSFKLFMRMMGESQYVGRFFGDLSAVTLSNRDPRVLRELLLKDELHGRLVNGSDYPLPAIDPMISTRLLVWQGLLAEQDRPALGEIYSANPLLFDFVLKRRLRYIRNKVVHRFQPALFETARLFEF
jgi:predicted TIM-barrel fold metal-dependent hydrolase